MQLDYRARLQQKLGRPTKPALLASNEDFSRWQVWSWAALWATHDPRTRTSQTAMCRQAFTNRCDTKQLVESGVRRLVSAGWE